MWLVGLSFFYSFESLELGGQVITGSSLRLTERSVRTPSFEIDDILGHWVCWTIHNVWFFKIVLWLLSFQISMLFLFLLLAIWNGRLCLTKDYLEHFYLFYSLLCKVWPVSCLIQQDKMSLFLHKFSFLLH